MPTGYRFALNELNDATSTYMTSTYMTSTDTTARGYAPGCCHCVGGVHAHGWCPDTPAGELHGKEPMTTTTTNLEQIRQALSEVSELITNGRHKAGVEDLDRWLEPLEHTTDLPDAVAEDLRVLAEATRAQMANETISLQLVCDTMLDAFNALL